MGLACILHKLTNPIVGSKFIHYFKPNLINMDIDFIRDSYQNMSYDELIRISTTDAYGLTVQAQEIIKEEVTKRKLNTNILKGVEAQNTSYSIEEIDNSCNLV